MIEIIPSILTDSPFEVAELVKKCDGVVKRVHVDIIDGVFADNKTIDPSVLNDIEHDLLIDFHLMVNEPVNWIEKCVRAGADRIIAQVEMMNSVHEYIEEVTLAGLKAGVGIDLETDVDVIERRLLTDLDVVLVMSVQAGFGGQKFSEKALGKIKDLVEIREKDETPFTICDDGGITLEIIDDVWDAGADEVSIGRRLFEGDLKTNVEKFRKAA